ncbi:MAG: hypothetical protein ACE5H9_00220 [Anaerolineae bacterium]
MARPKPKRPSGAYTISKEAPKRKISKQKIILYIISVLIILSFALSFLASGLGGLTSHGGP